MLTEDIDMHQWVLASHVEMNTLWSLSNFKLMFIDGLITGILPNKLGIRESCLLRGDYYHILYEIWPN